MFQAYSKFIISVNFFPSNMKMGTMNACKLNHKDSYNIFIVNLILYTVYEHEFMKLF